MNTTPRDPFDGIDGGVDLALTSDDFDDGQRLPLESTAEFVGQGGKDVSPQLSWGEVPEGTKSIMVTCYDPDAPTQAGWWHWTVANLPADLRSLARGASVDLPAGATTLKHDGGAAGYLGSAPPEGHGPHRYFFAVHALDIELDVDADTSPINANFQAFGHVIGRGVLVGIWEN